MMKYGMAKMSISTGDLRNYRRITMILDTYLDKAYRAVRNDMYIEDLQQRADAYDNLMGSVIQCPGCGETIQFMEGEDEGIQGDDNNQTDTG
jgi:hypothetical protein